jgi:hypothetical protein
MSKPMTILFRALIVLVLVGAATYSPTPAAACPPFENLTIWYNNCGAGKTEVGWHDRFCNCGSTQSGMQDGLFKEVHFINCDTDEDTVTYYGRCNYGDPWEVLAGPDDCPNHC